MEKSGGGVDYSNDQGTLGECEGSVLLTSLY